MIETDALVISDAANTWRSDPCAFWLDVARDQIEELDAILGRPGSNEAASAIVEGRCTLVVMLNDGEALLALGILFPVRDPVRQRQTMFAAITSDDPVFDFGSFVRRIERAAVANGLRHINIAAPNRRGFVGYEITRCGLTVNAVRTLPLH